MRSTLRQGAFLTDGTELTAKAVADSTAAYAKGPRGGNAALISRIVPVSKFVLEVHYSQAVTYALVTSQLSQRSLLGRSSDPGALQTQGRLRPRVTGLVRKDRRVTDNDGQRVHARAELQVRQPEGDQDKEKAEGDR